MIWWHVLRKTLRETGRRPLYLTTLLGIPLAFMVIFAAALPSDTASEAEDPDAGAAAAGAHSFDPTGAEAAIRGPAAHDGEPAAIISSISSLPSSPSTQAADGSTSPIIVDVTPSWIDGSWTDTQRDDGRWWRGLWEGRQGSETNDETSDEPTTRGGWRWGGRS